MATVNDPSDSSSHPEWHTVDLDSITYHTHSTANYLIFLSSFHLSRDAVALPPDSFFMSRTQ